MSDLGGTYDEMSVKNSVMHCPYCSELIESHAGAMSGSGPGNGDVLACWGCGLFAVFQITWFGMELRKPTTEELDEILHSAAAQKAMA